MQRFPGGRRDAGHSDSDTTGSCNDGRAMKHVTPIHLESAMTSSGLFRRRLLATAGTGVLTLAMAACGGGSLGGDEGGGGDGGGGDGGGGTIKVGLVIPQAGVYTPLGEDMQQGWDLWLEQNDGMMGGYEVETVIADEGEGPDVGVPAIQRLLQEEQVDVVVGSV